MTDHVHFFRCFIDAGSMSLSDLETQIDDWVSSNAEWTDDNFDHSLFEKKSLSNGDVAGTYYQIDVRFLLENSKSNLLQKFKDKLKEKVSWFRVGYEKCTHNGSGTPCGLWDDAVDWTAKDVTIPSHVETFEVSA